MQRPVALAFAAAAMLLTSVIAAGPSSARTPGTNGQILFMRRQVDFGNPGGHETFRQYLYTANPDGTHARKLSSATGELGSWSPDGTQIALLTDVCDWGAVCAAYLVDATTGAVTTVPGLDPTLRLLCGGAWSPDGTRLACSSSVELFGGDPSRDGIYTIRATDGGGLRRVTNVLGSPGDFSPDGTRLVFERPDTNDVQHLFVVKLNGGGLRQITPPDLEVNPGIGMSWSPDGATILFSGAIPGHTGALWTVRPDGTGLRQLPIQGCGAAFGEPSGVWCLRPHWSPDGTKIAFDLGDPQTGSRHVYTVNADGTDLVRVTSSGLEDYDPDWGTHPLTA